mgnify:CR=1 FL=1|jgi:hypothetical protein
MTNNKKIKKLFKWNGEKSSKLPKESEMFGRQPSHTESFNPEKFKETMKEIDEIPSWRFDY